MDIEASLTILVSSDVTRIEVRDNNANVCFLRIELTPVQLSQCLSRLANVKCNAEIVGLDKIGTTHENKSFEFEIPETLRSSSKAKELHEIAVSKLNESGKSEWIPDKYFASQDSFFNNDGKTFARCVIRRWITTK